MRPQALFFNGNFEGNLECIADVQSILPEQILFIQPLMNRDIAYLRDNPPSVDDPVTLYASLFSDKKKISYTGEIVGWEIKSEISTKKRNAIEKILECSPAQGRRIVRSWTKSSTCSARAARGTALFGFKSHQDQRWQTNAVFPQAWWIFVCVFTERCATIC